ncbi:DMT family transporter [Candidatus Saccharibacteria bacterium]|nr:DMT family transporter [Candidatus Saccharibacteria bacterium]
MSWLGFVLVGVLAYAGYYTLSRVFLKDKKSDAVIYAILFNIVCTLIVGAYACTQGFELLDISAYWLNILVMGVIYALAQVFIFQASKMTEASEVIIISSTRILWAIGAAIVFLDENFTLQKSIGAALILVAVALVSYQKSSKKKKASKSVVAGRVYALLAGLCLGIGFVNDSYILKTADAPSYAALVFFVPTLMTLLIYRPSVSKFKKQLNATLLRNSALLGMFYAIGILASYTAYQKGGDASQIVPIGQSVVILTVLFSVVFLSERDHLARKALGTTMVTLGVLLLI